MLQDFFFPLLSKRFWTLVALQFALVVIFGVFMMTTVLVAVSGHLSDRAAELLYLGGMVFYVIAVPGALAVNGYVLSLSQAGYRGQLRELPPYRFWASLRLFLVVAAGWLFVLGPPLVGATVAAEVALAGVAVAGGGWVFVCTEMSKNHPYLGTAIGLLGTSGFAVLALLLLVAFVLGLIWFYALFPLLQARVCVTGRILDFLRWRWAWRTIGRAPARYALRMAPLVLTIAAFHFVYFMTLGLGTLLMYPLLVLAALNYPYQAGRFLAEFGQLADQARSDVV